jgi:hypothetical protein
MANVKITQLPLATTPLTGTEVFPLVQGTTTKQVAITGLFTSPVMTNPTLGTVGQADLINATGLPISTGVAGLGTGVATFLGTPSSTNLRAAVTDETGTGSLVFATSPTLVTPNLGTPSVLVATNATGTAVGLTAGSAITNANLTGAVTSVGNATSLGSFTSAQLRTALTDDTGSGVAVFATSPTITAPILNQINDTNNAQILGLSPTTSAVDYFVVKNGTGVGVPLHFYADGSSANIGLHIQPKGTGLVTISDGTDFNKGIRFRSSSSAASAITLLDAVSTAGRVVTLPDATTTLVGRDTTDTLTNKTIAFSSNTFSGTLGTANGGTNLSSFTSGGVVYASSTSALATGSALTFDGTNLSSTGGATFQGGPTAYGGGEIRLGSTSASLQNAISTQGTGTPQLIFDHRGTSNTGTFTWRNGTGGSNILLVLGATGNMLLATSTNKTTAFSGNGTGLTIGGALAPTLALYDTTNTAYVFNLTQIDADTYFVNTTSGILSFQTNNIERYRVSADGTFRIKGAGTAGSTDAVQFSPSAPASSMSLDASGNLLVGTTTNTNTSKLVVNGTISQTVSGTQYLVVDQSDIGTAANEIPLNQYLGRMAYKEVEGLEAQLNPAPTIASAATIQPLTPITFVSGTTTINTITVPAEFVGGGQITLIPTALWSTGTSGNIAIATTGVVSKALILTYDATTAKWYPSY